MRVSAAFNSQQAMIALLPRLVPNTAVTDRTCHLALFSGPVPTDDQMMTLLGSAASVAPISAAAIASFATASNFLGSVALGSFTPVVDPDNMILQLPLSAQTNNIAVAASGTPTFFIFRQLTTAQTASTFDAFAATGNAYTLLWGTVGNENSQADMKIVGGTVTAGQAIRPSDIRIKF